MNVFYKKSIFEGNYESDNESDNENMENEFD